MNVEYLFNEFHSIPFARLVRHPLLTGVHSLRGPFSRHTPVPDQESRHLPTELAGRERGNDTATSDLAGREESTAMDAHRCRRARTSRSAAMGHVERRRPDHLAESVQFKLSDENLLQSDGRNAFGQSIGTAAATSGHLLREHRTHTGHFGFVRRDSLPGIRYLCRFAVQNLSQTHRQNDQVALRRKRVLFT